MIILIIFFIAIILIMFSTNLLMNIINDKRRMKDPVFDKYLTKNNIRTRFDD